LQTATLSSGLGEDASLSSSVVVVGDVAALKTTRLKPLNSTLLFSWRDSEDESAASRLDEDDDDMLVVDSNGGDMLDDEGVVFFYIDPKFI